jgi:hypothetical protein
LEEYVAEKKRRDSMTQEDLEEIKRQEEGDDQESE